MKCKRAIMAGFGLVIFSAGFWAGKSNLQTVRAQDPPIKVTIPASWGHCVASVPGGLVFEDSQGAIRMTDMHGYVQAEFDRD